MKPLPTLGSSAPDGSLVFVRPRLARYASSTLLFVASLPGFGALFLRVYENTLVRQTEAERVAQGAALTAAAAAAVRPGAKPAALAAGYAPEATAIDLGETPVLPERPAALAAPDLADPAARTAAERLAPIAAQTARTTLASIILVDRSGVIVLGAGTGRRLANVAELDRALGGVPATALRRNDAYHPRYPLERLSRASALRTHHARPVIVDGRIAGALLLSRSPRVLFRGLYEDRGKIALGIGLIFAMLLVLTGLLSRGIARPIEAFGRATRDVAGGRGLVPEAPVTAAIEIRALYADFALMAAAIERRSRYLRDFATAVSHEFKTPLAAIRGAIELIDDHDATMTVAERRRSLANMAADAHRLGNLVSRLPDLARADMTQPATDAVVDLGSAVARVADHTAEASEAGISAEWLHGKETTGYPRSSHSRTHCRVAHFGRKPTGGLRPDPILDTQLGLNTPQFRPFVQLMRGQLNMQGVKAARG